MVKSRSTENLATTSTLSHYNPFHNTRIIKTIQIHVTSKAVMLFFSLSYNRDLPLIVLL